MTYRRITIILCLVFLLISRLGAFSQEKSFRISIDFPPGIAHPEWIHKVNESSFSDSLEMVNALKALRGKYYRIGYLSAGLDFLNSDGNTYKAKFSSGRQYNWGCIKLPEYHSPGVSRIPRSVKIRAGKPVSIEESESTREALVKIYENSGYPFVSVRYDSLSLSDGIIHANLFVEPGPLVLIDSIINRSENIVSNKVLEQMIGLKPGQAYSEKKLADASNQLNNSSIIQLVNPLEVGFNDDKAWIFLGARKKTANSFDGIVGLVPGAANSRGFALTGSLDLLLSNLLKQAETFSIRWKAPGNQNQRFQAALDVPYFIGWPVGFSSSMEIFRKDSSYLNTSWSFGIQASIQNNNRIGFYYKEKASNVLLRIPSANLSDVKVKLYGLAWSLDKLQNPLNPTKGIYINTDFGVGSKISSNSENVEESNVYWEANAVSDFFIPIAKTWVFHLGARGAYLNGGQVYENEKFKIGGLHSLRGFEEESILADAYLIGTFELRYLFSKNSNAHLFMDVGNLWYPGAESDIVANPRGFGIGVSLETRAGILLLDYALGASQDIPVNIRQSKIHLGIKSLF